MELPVGSILPGITVYNLAGNSVTNFMIHMQAEKLMFKFELRFIDVISGFKVVVELTVIINIEVIVAVREN
jgi:hypothetical protein